MNTQKTKPWYAQIKSNFWRAAISPFFICWDRGHSVETFVWLMFAIIAGQLGTIINLIQRWIFGEWDFQVALAPDTASGSFYTFALVLFASLVGPWFIRIVKKEKPEYRPIVIVFVTILIFLLLLCAVFYSAATQNVNITGFEGKTNGDMHLDIKQFAFFVLAIICAWYSYGLFLSREHENILNLDYQAADDEGRNRLSGTANGRETSPPAAPANNSNTTSAQSQSGETPINEIKM